MVLKPWWGLLLLKRLSKLSKLIVILNMLGRIMQNSELIIYQSQDGVTKVEAKFDGDNIWLTQKQLAELFGKDKSVISRHISNIFADGELHPDSVVANFATTASDGKVYSVDYYNLDAIIAVGYRVNSLKATHFRIWATKILKEYIIKGFAMDDERLKQDSKWDYFDEWLERIREIRASEKRFYQKVSDLYATAINYDKVSPQARNFFAKVQNKMLWAVTGKTAAELICYRSNETVENMGLTSWKGSRVRKPDVAIAKNYLSNEELEELNRIVSMYLDYAEDQAKRRAPVTMQQWSDKLEAFLTFNDREVLRHAGSIKHEVAKKLAEDRYDIFDANRKKQEAIEADKEDLKVLEKHYQITIAKTKDS